MRELQAELGSDSTLTPLTEGEESRAFGFRRGGEDLVLRVNRSDEGFAKDTFIRRIFSSDILPVPEILSLGTLVNGDAYCISRKAPGRTLQDLSASELEPVLAPTAQIMTAIAKADVGATEGFGRFDASGRGIHESWRAFLLSIDDPRCFDWDAQRIDRPVVKSCLELCRALAAHCPEIRGLVHGDFGSNNVLTDGRRITGVIDWSEALYGDPLYDLANILFWRPWLICMEAQARWFEREAPHLLAHRERLLCYQLRIGLAELHDSAQSGDDDDVAWATTRCAEIKAEA